MGSHKRKAALGVGVALLLLGTVAWFSQRGAERVNAMDSMIQSRALANHGRVLNDNELVKVKGLLGKVPHHLRKLDADDADDEVSKQCALALVEAVADTMGKLLELGLDAFFKCLWNGEDSTKCKKAKSKLETFEEDLKKECKGRGDYCTLLENTADGQESQHVCVPEACHGHEDLIEEVATKELQKEPDCSDCTAEIKC